MANGTPNTRSHVSKIDRIKQDAKMLSVNENLNRVSESTPAGLLDYAKYCAQRVSKSSEMLDNLRLVPAQPVSRMSKMPKLYFIKERLNQPDRIRRETALREACPKWTVVSRGRGKGRGVQNLQNPRIPRVLRIPGLLKASCSTSVQNKLGRCPEWL